MKTRLQKVLSGLESRGIYFTSASEYGEPGYSTDKPIILFADWNVLNRSEMRAVESVAEIEWSDEWITDDDGVKCYRTSPDSYGWESSIIWGDGYFIPVDELGEGETLLSHLEELGFICEPGDKPRSALPSNVPETSLEEIAELVSDDNETGFHPGQNANPEKVLSALPSGRYVARISGKGQFDITWQFWRLRDEQAE